MAGKIVADTLEHSTAGSLDTQYVVNGSAKAWAKVTQDTTHTNNSSFNISSIVDGGTGETDLLFTSNMSDADFVVGKAEYTSNNRRSIVETPSTSQSTIQTFQVSTNSTASDATSGVAQTIMGDLA
jgi:hypothetical protein